MLHWAVEPSFQGFVNGRCSTQFDVFSLTSFDLPFPAHQVFYDYFDFLWFGWAAGAGVMLNFPTFPNLAVVLNLSCLQDLFEFDSEENSAGDRVEINAIQDFSHFAD